MYARPRLTLKNLDRPGDEAITITLYFKINFCSLEALKFKPLGILVKGSTNLLSTHVIFDELLFDEVSDLLDSIGDGQRWVRLQHGEVMLLPLRNKPHVSRLLLRQFTVIPSRLVK